jgi:hypothetical protein
MWECVALISVLAGVAGAAAVRGRNVPVREAVASGAA